MRGLFLLFSIFSLHSCSPSKDDKITNIDIHKRDSMEMHFKKGNSISIFLDDVDLNTCLEYQEYVGMGRAYIVSDLDLSDIYKQDSFYYITWVGIKGPYKIKCTQVQAHELVSLRKTSNALYCISKIKTVSFLHNDSDNIYKWEGELIEYYDLTK